MSKYKKDGLIWDFENMTVESEIGNNKYELMPDSIGRLMYREKGDTSPFCLLRNHSDVKIEWRKYVEENNILFLGNGYEAT